MDKPVIERDEVQRLSRLAHLELDEGELEAMVVELGAIVAYVNTLEAVDVEGVAVPRHFGLQRLALRPDEPRPSLDRDVVLDQTPGATAAGFAVPTVVDEG